MKKIFSLFLISGVLIFSNANGQFKIYIKASVSGDGTVEGNFDGGSVVKGHEKEIEAWTYSYGLAGCSNSPLGGGSSACKVVGSSFVFSMPFNNSLMSFKNALLLGKHLVVDVDFVKTLGGGPFIYYQMRMDNVQIVSIQEAGSNDDLPSINIELQPQKIAWQINIRNPNGSTGTPLKYGWDFATNKAWNFNF
jgi:type VI protein secretion system component Hcp